jgi:hypothetical protein
MESRQKMIEQVMVNQRESAEDEPVIIPVHIPEMNKTLAFASTLAKANVEYEGRFEGWACHFSPYSPMPPHGSRAPFTPAMFFIGALGIWCVCLDWNNGNHADPDVLVSDDNIIRNGKIPPFRSADQIIAEIEAGRGGVPYAPPAPYYRIMAVEHVENYILRLTFNTGEVGVIDLAGDIVGSDGMFTALQDMKFFARVQVDPDLSTVVWPNGVDLDPDRLYLDSMRHR